MGDPMTAGGMRACEETSARSTPRSLGVEVLLVLGVSLGASAVYAIVQLVDRLTRVETLAAQSTTLNASVSPRPWFDLTYQLLDIGFVLVPVALALFFLGGRSVARGAWVIGLGLRGRADRAGAGSDHLVRSGAAASDGGGAGPTRRAEESAAVRDGSVGPVPEDRAGRSGLGGRRDTWGLRLGHGAALFTVIGVPGLLFYALGRVLGITVSVQASGLSGAWWTVPVLVLAALKNGLLEETVVVGYLVERCEAMGWSGRRVVVVSAMLRGCYHLYQGVGPGIGNLVMGLVFAEYYRRTRRTWPLVVAHTLLDVVAFVGYALVPAAWLAQLGVV